MQNNPIIIVREATKSDMEAMVGLLEELFSIEKDFAIDPQKQRQGLCLMLQMPELRRVLVAQVDGKVVGMCSAQLTVSTAQGGLSGLVEDLVVTESFRGLGIGTKLLGMIRQWAMARGATRLQLLADKTNITGLDFYRKQGWITTRMICLKFIPEKKK